MPSEMSAERLLTEAQTLRNRLRDMDSISDSVIMEAQNLNHKMESLREYNENQLISDHNQSNNSFNHHDGTSSNTGTIIYHQPRLSLISRMQRESKMLRRLEQENVQLKCALEEHKQALEMIMAKYRQQVSTLVALDRTDRAMATQPPQVIAFNQDVRFALDGYEDKMKEMAAVMQEACRIDEAKASKDEQKIARLEKENAELRRLLLVPPVYPVEPDNDPVKETKDEYEEEQETQDEPDRDDTSE